MILKRNVKYLYNIVGGFFSIIILLPLYFVLINSFKTIAEASELKLTIPNKWQILENYKYVLENSNLLSGYINSIIYTGISVFLIVILSSMAGFVIQRRAGSRILQFIYLTIVIGLVMPASMVPTFFVVKTLHINGTYLAIILVYVANWCRQAIFLYTGFYATIPREIDEAAIIDGCGPFRLYFSIIFPLIKPATAAVVALSMIQCWNDIYIILFLTGNPKKYNAVMTTYNFFSSQTAYWNLVFANVVLVSLPVIIAYFSLQKYIIGGLASGAVKG